MKEAFQGAVACRPWAKRPVGIPKAAWASWQLAVEDITSLSWRPRLLVYHAVKAACKPTVSQMPLFRGTECEDGPGEFTDS
eukprot:CAMPEP_0174362234 /NCGR_PEP_ID=MMETSP0811_2-20130205/63357_1 /TAXON_ID=73025 ORGANISM="Eutreptiella gymnastica-like, Strain CCMP1594" /NCGR_SAMPLE_ID=MMETSP0811_2 /ASSEMBLY_ACC=CAM_ASM_000667 /LENGTH=80 /DNA_ID=CAMNT_0015499709 /DNA_START=32 /DNA_END=274 /DNA_ORIENTATION=-